MLLIILKVLFFWRCIYINLILKDIFAQYRIFCLAVVIFQHLKFVISLFSGFHYFCCCLFLRSAFSVLIHLLEVNIYIFPSEWIWDLRFHLVFIFEWYYYNISRCDFFFVFILLGLHRASLNCGLMSFVGFEKCLAIVCKYFSLLSWDSSFTISHIILMFLFTFSIHFSHCNNLRHRYI